MILIRLMTDCKLHTMKLSTPYWTLSALHIERCLEMHYYKD